MRQCEWCHANEGAVGVREADGSFIQAPPGLATLADAKQFHREPPEPLEGGRIYQICLTTVSLAGGGQATLCQECLRRLHLSRRGRKGESAPAGQMSMFEV